MQEVIEQTSLLLIFNEHHCPYI